MMRRDSLNDRIGKQGAIALTSALEYLTSEILEIAGNLAQEARKKRIVNRHLMLGIQTDDELAKCFNGIIMYQGGVRPKIEDALLPKKKGKGMGHS